MGMMGPRGTVNEYCEGSRGRVSGRHHALMHTGPPRPSEKPALLREAGVQCSKESLLCVGVEMTQAALGTEKAMNKPVSRRGGGL